MSGHDQEDSPAGRLLGMSDANLKKIVSKVFIPLTCRHLVAHQRLVFSSCGQTPPGLDRMSPSFKEQRRVKFRDADMKVGAGPRDLSLDVCKIWAQRDAAAAAAAADLAIIVHDRHQAIRSARPANG